MAIPGISQMKKRALKEVDNKLKNLDEEHAAYDTLHDLKNNIEDGDYMAVVDGIQKLDDLEKEGKI